MSHGLGVTVRFIFQICNLHHHTTPWTRHRVWERQSYTSPRLEEEQTSGWCHSLIMASWDWDEDWFHKVLCGMNSKKAVRGLFPVCGFNWNVVWSFPVIASGGSLGNKLQHSKDYHHHMLFPWEGSSRGILHQESAWLCVNQIYHVNLTAHHWGCCSPSRKWAQAIPTLIQRRHIRGNGCRKSDSMTSMSTFKFSCE